MNNQKYELSKKVLLFAQISTLQNEHLLLHEVELSGALSFQNEMICFTSPPQTQPETNLSMFLIHFLRPAFAMQMTSDHVIWFAQNLATCARKSHAGCRSNEPGMRMC